MSVRKNYPIHELDLYNALLIQVCIMLFIRDEYHSNLKFLININYAFVLLVDLVEQFEAISIIDVLIYTFWIDLC